MKQLLKTSLLSTALLLTLSSCSKDDVPFLTEDELDVQGMSDNIALVTLDYAFQVTKNLGTTIPASIPSTKIMTNSAGLSSGGYAVFSGTSTTNGTKSVIILNSELNKFGDYFKSITGTSVDTITIDNSTQTILEYRGKTSHFEVKETGLEGLYQGGISQNSITATSYYSNLVVNKQNSRPSGLIKEIIKRPLGRPCICIGLWGAAVVFLYLE